HLAARDVHLDVARVDVVLLRQPVAHILADALVGALVVLGPAEHTLHAVGCVVEALAQLLTPALVVVVVAALMMARTGLTAVGLPARVGTRGVPPMLFFAIAPARHAHAVASLALLIAPEA